MRTQAIVLQEKQRLINDWRSVALVGSSSWGDEYLTSESIHDALWQTCVAGIFDKSREDTARMYQRFETRHRLLRDILILVMEDHLWVFMTIALEHLRLHALVNDQFLLSTIDGSLFSKRSRDNAPQWYRHL
jgi:hypothetical protein